MRKEPKKHHINLGDFFEKDGKYYHLVTDKYESAFGEIVHFDTWNRVEKEDIPEGMTIYNNNTAKGCVPFARILEGTFG